MELKKTVSALLTAAIAGSAATAFAWQPQGIGTWEEASRDGVTARFFVGSDVHIGRDEMRQTSSATLWKYSIQLILKRMRCCLWEM